MSDQTTAAPPLAPELASEIQALAKEIAAVLTPVQARRFELLLNAVRALPCPHAMAAAETLVGTYNLDAIAPDVASQIPGAEPITLHVEGAYDPPAAPSTRVSEAELLEVEARAGRELQLLATPSDNWQELERLDVEDARARIAETHARGADQDARLVAEIRRYRALLLGLARTKNGECPRKLGGECRWCDQRDGVWAARIMGREPGEHDIVEPHREDCPWAELEAEVQAIRAERKQP